MVADIMRALLAHQSPLRQRRMATNEMPANITIEKAVGSGTSRPLT
jgi:hypothetical protein